MTLDSTGIPVATGQNPTRGRGKYHGSALTNIRYSRVTHFSVMGGSADSVSRPVVCRWREDTVPLGGVSG